MTRERRWRRMKSDNKTAEEGEKKQRSEAHEMTKQKNKNDFSLYCAILRYYST
jgi:hypothetical protein